MLALARRAAFAVHAPVKALKDKMHPEELWVRCPLAPPFTPPFALSPCPLDATDRCKSHTHADRLCRPRLALQSLNKDAPEGWRRRVAHLDHLRGGEARNGVHVSKEMVFLPRGMPGDGRSISEQLREALPSLEAWVGSRREDDDAGRGERRRVHMELCSGFGQWIVDRARREPDVDWLAVEMKTKRCLNIVGRAISAGVPNVQVVRTDAKNGLALVLPPGSVDDVFINFPDPWPRKRQQKRRLVDEHFIEHLSKMMRPGGTLTTVTDHGELNEHMTRVIASNADFVCTHPDEPFLASIADYGSSAYEDVWRSRNRDIFHVVFRRK